MTSLARILIVLSSLAVSLLLAFLWIQSENDTPALAVEARAYVPRNVVPHDPAAEAHAPVKPSEASERRTEAGTGISTPPSEEPAATEVSEPVRQHIRILSPDGEALPGCSVSVTTGGQAVPLMTDAGGLCSFDLVEAMPWSLIATDGDRARSGKVTAATFPGGMANPQDIRLHKLARVRGMVLLREGVPAVGALVEAKLVGMLMFRGTPEGARTVADSSGSFELLLEATGGEYEFSAEWSGREPCVEHVRITPGEEATVLLRFHEVSEWSGMVVTPSGRPVSNASVHVVAAETAKERKNVLFPVQVLATDQAGLFRLETRPSDPAFLIATHSDWCSSTPLEFLPGAAKPDEGMVLRLVNPTEITGRVTWEDGSPVAGAFISALRDWQDAEDDPATAAGHAELLYGMVVTETDADGRFRVAPVRSGDATYAVTCLPDSTKMDQYTTFHKVAPGTSDLELVLSALQLRGSVLRATVKREDTGVPLQRFTTILYRRLEDGSWRAETRGGESEQGLIVRDGLEPGETYAMAILPVTGYTTALIDPWQATDQEHVVDALLRVPISVELIAPVALDGNARGSIYVVPVSPHPHLRQPLSAALDRDGRQTFRLWPDKFVAYISEPDGERIFETEFEVLPQSNGLMVLLGE